jgi:site-specific DNA recombinase
MLLSFAQFEREVTAERIRDKFAASKRKGMWMGGVVPLGYDARERKLHVNMPEAETVQWLFASYLELGSVPLLREAAERRGMLSKRRSYKSGRNLGGTPLARGHLYAMLSNPVYIGKVRHKDRIHDGQHAAIVDEGTYDKVQAMLQANAATPRGSTTMQDRHLLTGLIFDETGDRLTPSHASKKGRRYRYYVSNRLLQAKRNQTDGWRLPADQVDRIVVNRIAALLTDRSSLAGMLSIGEAAIPAGRIMAMEIAAEQALSVLRTGTATEKRGLLHSWIGKITISRDEIRIEINLPILQGALLGEAEAIDTIAPAEPIVITLPMRLRRRGIEARLVLDNPSASSSKPDPALVNLLADANHFMEQLTSGNSGTLADLARKTGRAPTEISRILPLAFLAPDLVRKILEGRQPAELTAQTLKRTKPLPVMWSEQHLRLGFAPRQLTHRRITPAKHVASKTRPQRH